MALLVGDKIDFKLDLVTGDLDLTGGRLNLSSGAEGVAQSAMIRVKRIKGEWFWNRQTGIPLTKVDGIVTKQEALLDRPFDRVKFENALRPVLEGTEGVERVLLLEASEDKVTRAVRSRWQLRTVFGDTPITSLEH